MSELFFFFLGGGVRACFLDLGHQCPIRHQKYEYKKGNFHWMVFRISGPRAPRSAILILNLISHLLPCPSHCFSIFNILIDWRSSYHMHKILCTYFLDRKTMSARHTIYTKKIKIKKIKIERENIHPLILRRLHCLRLGDQLLHKPDNYTRWDPRSDPDPIKNRENTKIFKTFPPT